jgi:glycosyltransferase involved in cell wall biosynthesis
LVSIIIPHLNRSILLRDSIQSVLDQTYKDWEIIIIDDGSTQEEFDIIKRFERIDDRIRIYQRQSDCKGPSACRNEAVSKSKFCYLIFLDSDDLLKPFCLEQRLQFMLENPFIKMAVFLEENFSHVPGDLNTIFNLNVPHEKLVGSFLQNKNPWQTMAPIWKKSFFMKLWGFDEELLYMEDPDLHIRALIDSSDAIRICYNKPADCLYRINHADNTKNNFYYHSIKYRNLFYQKIIRFLKERNLLIQHSKDVKKGLNNFNRIFLYSRIKEFPSEYKVFISLLKESGLYSKYELLTIQLCMNSGNSNSRWASALKLKGLFYRLLSIS